MMTRYVYKGTTRSCYMMKWHTCALRVNKSNTMLTKKRDLVTQVYAHRQINVILTHVTD